MYLLEGARHSQLAGISINLENDVRERHEKLI